MSDDSKLPMDRSQSPHWRDHLPDHVDPFKLVEQTAVIDGALKLADLPRLLELSDEQDLVSADGASAREVSVHLAFYRDEEHRRLLGGSLATTVRMQCQRCLECFDVPVTSDFTLGLVVSQAQADALPAQYDPLLVEDDASGVRRVSLLQVIEDEILLVLPAFPVHEDDACKAVPVINAINQQGDEAIASAPERKNPFRVLQGLASHDSFKSGTGEAAKHETE